MGACCIYHIKKPGKSRLLIVGFLLVMEYHLGYEYTNI